MSLDEWIEREFAGFGVAVREKGDAPIPGEPFMSMMEAKRLTRKAVAVFSEPAQPRSFDEAFADHRLTPAERAALVWQLANIRTRKLIETLLPETPFNQVMADFAAGVLRSNGEIAKGPK